MASSASGSGASVSPTVALLEAGLHGGTLVKSPDGHVYTGFADFRDLAGSNFIFRPMNSNRAINKDVVAARVRANTAHLASTGSFLDFGQINLLVLRSDPVKAFLVMDGQHRCLTMQGLLSLDKPINFQFRVKVVDSEGEAASELLHFQNSYASDNRAFFPTQAQTKLATACLDVVKVTFPSPDLFKKVAVASRAGARVGDPDRPFLTDFLFFGLLRDSGLVAKHALDADAEALITTVIDMNARMKKLATANRGALGVGVSKSMVDKAEKLGCFLGLFRPGKLEWSALTNLDGQGGGDDDDDGASRPHKRRLLTQGGGPAAANGH